MSNNYAYNNDVRKWGLFARAILKRPELLVFFVEKGLKQSEIEDVSTTEDTARQADNIQREAEQRLSVLTPQVQKSQEALLELFGELKLRTPNVARDLQSVGDEASAKVISALSFSEKAVPRLPGQPPEENQSKEAEPEPETVTEDRESKSQKVLANAALRTAEYLQDKAAIVDAFINRKMPSDFIKELRAKGDELMHLREERILLVEKKKTSTKAEHDAVKEHIKARGIIEPTVTTLCSKDSSIDALAVEHLGRKSAQKK